MASKTLRRQILQASSFSKLKEEKGALLFHGVGNAGLIDISRPVADRIVNLVNNHLIQKPLLTFDDAYLEIHELVESWSQLGNQIIVFVSTDIVGRTLNGKRVADWDQLRSWSKLKNVSIQAHGHTHTNLTRLTQEERIHELIISKELIESKLQLPCKEIAFPRGKFNKIVLEDVANAGYINGWTTDRGLISQNTSRLTLPRLSVYQHSTPRSVLGEFSIVARNLDRLFQKGVTQ